MRKFTLRILFVLVILWGGDALVGMGLDWFRDHSPDGRYYKIKYSLLSCKEEVIVIGSSRGEMDYVPQIIEDSLGMSCWNAGRGGEGPPYFRAIEEGILARYTPKVVIINVDENDLELPPDYAQAGILRPYYQCCPPIRPVLDKASTFESVLLRSRLYQYNSSFYYLFRPYLLHGLDGNTDEKGWKPLSNKLPAGLDLHLQPEPVRMPLNPESVELFETLVCKFRERGCQVFIVTPPNLGRTVSASSGIEYLKDCSSRYDIPVIMYSNDTSFIMRPDYYADTEHLNREGAQIFTSNLAHRIKPLLQTRRVSVSKDNIKKLKVNRI